MGEGGFGRPPLLICLFHIDPGSGCHLINGTFIYFNENVARLLSSPHKKFLTKSSNF